MVSSLTARGKFLRDTVCVSAAFASFFVFCEVLKVHRSGLFTGAEPREWLSALLGGLVYLGALFGLALVGLGTVFSFARNRFLKRSLLVIWVCSVSAAVLWAFVRNGQDSVTDRSDMVMFGGIVLTGLLFQSLSVWRSVPLSALSTRYVVAMVSGIAAVQWGHEVFLFSPRRAEYLTIAALVWVIEISGDGFSTLLLRDSSVRRWAFGAVALVGFSLPVLTANLFPMPQKVPRDVSRPNMVLIVSDGFRADAFTRMGDPELSHALKKLSQVGVVYNRCYATAASTLPSLLSLHASVYPPEAALHTSQEQKAAEPGRFGFRSHDVLLAEVLRDRGYRTCAVVANPAIQDMPGALRGFQQVCFTHPFVPETRGPFRLLPALRSFVGKYLPGTVDTHFHDSTRDVLRYALEFVRRDPYSPFFLYVHLIDPQAPYDPPDDFHPKDVPSPALLGFHPEAYQGYSIPTIKDSPSDETKRQIRALYDAEVRYVDRSVRRLLAELDLLKLGASSYVCFTASHGEEFWEHGAWGHGQSLYDEVVRVPLILAGRGIRPRVEETPVSLLDVAPTLASLAGAGVPTVWQGNVLPVLPTRTTVVLTPQPVFARAVSADPPDGSLEMVVFKGYKGVLHLNTGAFLLFSLDNDPQEKQNLAPQHPEIVADLQARLEQWRREHFETLDGFYEKQLPISANAFTPTVKSTERTE
ncbi:MAG TPA: sulfatase-like hydrolase/transferase [Candidatus Hydrogenedentes bacterium]|nr:sulfatase-like hydrolase/transferase [Candidatus Hydrogenedentota bacterium]HOL76335.1 sulfatase-like hydrolase/transferase [Candidatus Hydrogenedentota bacterium]